MKKNNGYWTYERCYNVVKNCKTKNEFKQTGGAYCASQRNGWLYEFSFMLNGYKCSGYWTYEKCKEESLKYNKIKDLKKNSPGAYNRINKNKWQNDMFSHMEKLGNKNKRVIYSYEFSNNYVYVGLTGNIERRDKQHRVAGPVYNHFKNTSIEIPIIKKITDFISENDASKMEGIILNDYKKNGWISLNKSLPGGLGGGKIKWTKEKIEIESLKFNNKTDFKINSPQAYYTASKNKIINDVCSHMKPKHNKLTYEQCKAEALKYYCRIDLQKKSSSVYNKCYRNNWLNDVCSHMKPNYSKLTYEQCKAEALKYKYRNEFRINYSGYYIARKNNWLNDICSHMKKQKSKISKKVIQFTLDEKQIKIFNSLTEAKENTKINNISNCCNNKRKSAGGYKWKFYN